jgi:YfiH family protein
MSFVSAIPTSPDSTMPMTLIPHGQPPYYFTFPGLAAGGLAHATTSRHCPGLRPWADAAGPFPPEGATALAPAGIDLARAAYARQIHGAHVASVAGPGFAGQADALLTTRPGVPLAIFTADCLALVMHDAEAGVLAAVHAGWRGTVQGAAPAAVSAACAAGARAGRLRVAIAPSIGPCCYEVDGPVIERLSAAYPEDGPRWAHPVSAGHWKLDLWRANEDQLARAGIAPDRIENPRVCTACHPELFFSYRKANHGRLLTVAALAG